MVYAYDASYPAAPVTVNVYRGSASGAVLVYRFQSDLGAVVQATTDARYWHLFTLSIPATGTSITLTPTNTITCDSQLTTPFFGADEGQNFFELFDVCI